MPHDKLSDNNDDKISPHASPNTPLEGARINRRAFLKKAGEIGLGSILVGGNLYKQITNDMRGKLRKLEETNDVHYGEELNREVAEIKTKFGDKWQKEARDRIHQGIILYTTKVGAFELKESPQRYYTEFGIIEGAILAKLKIFLQSHGGKPKDLEELNQLFLAAGIGGSLGEAIKKTLEFHDKKIAAYDQVFVQTVEEEVFRALPENKNNDASFEDAIRLDITNNYALLNKSLNISGALEKWGAGGYRMYTELYRGINDALGPKVFSDEQESK